MEWKISKPKAGDTRFIKEFALFPTKIHRGNPEHVVWLGFIRRFERLKEPDPFDGDGPYWTTIIIQSPKEYKEFVKNLASHLVSDDKDTRELAQLILERGNHEMED